LTFVRKTNSEEFSRGAESVILTHRGNDHRADDPAKFFCQTKARAEAVMRQMKTNAAAEVA
jgi:hypothetical protein